MARNIVIRFTHLFRKTDVVTRAIEELERLVSGSEPKGDSKLMKIRVGLRHKLLPPRLLNDLPAHLVRSAIQFIYASQNSQPYLSAEPFIEYVPHLIKFYIPEAPPGIDEVLKYISEKYGLAHSFLKIGEAIAEDSPIKFGGEVLVLPEGKEKLDLAVKMIQFSLMYEQGELHNWGSLARIMNQKANLTSNSYGELQDARLYFNLVIDRSNQDMRRHSKYRAPVEYEFQYSRLKEKLDFLMQHPEQGEDFVNDADRTHKDLLRVWRKVKKHTLPIY